MEKLLNNLTENLKETFNQRLTSVFLYGSSAMEDYKGGKKPRESFSDINLMVIIKDLSAEDLKNAHPFVKKFAKKSKSMPIFMDTDEWHNSSDVYPIEYSDIKERYKILAGENLVDGLRVEKKHLRLQCELEVKNLLIRLRQAYLTNTSDKNALKSLIQSSSKTFMVVFRTVLRLSDEAVPKNHSDVVRFFWEKFKVKGIDFDGELFLRILDFRKSPKFGSKAIKSCEYEEVIQKLINSTNSVLKYVDKLEM